MSAIVVKFTTKKYRPEQYMLWRRQLPDGDDAWGDCRFVFDQDCRTYDWLVVNDDLAPRGDERFSTRAEPLACPAEHTMLLTGEPSSVKSYGKHYLDQFGVILTSQEPWALDHPRAVYTQTGLRWFYGDAAQPPLGWSAMMRHPPEAKTRLISTVCSNKSNPETLQPQRIALTKALQRAMPELDWFGKGYRPIEDKADAVAPYTYHVTIENHMGPHYWSEKLADAFLGLSLPFYSGCTNVFDYFPEDSLIAIDVRDVEGSIARIREVIAADDYEQRLPALREARRRVLEDYNLFAVIAREVERRHDPGRKVRPGATIYSRRALRRHNPAAALSHGYDRLRSRWRRLRARVGS